MKRLLLLAFVVALLDPGGVLAQWQKPVFTRLSTNEGLSQGFVHAILKDSKGFMWFATDEGLNKYDGYTFSVYKHNPDNRKSLRHSLVYDILEDKAGTIWVATAEGLDAFNRDSDDFAHYTFDPSALKIVDLFQDHQQQLWLGTTAGLYRINPVTRAFTVYRHLDADTNSLSHDYVLKITEDHAGMLWLATPNGLNRFNPVTHRFQAYFHHATDPASLSSNWIKTVYTDRRGTLWAGTLGGGVCRYNPAKATFTTFRHDPANPASIGHDDILSFMGDDQGRLWIGTENGGISMYNPATNQFNTFGNEATDNTSLSNNSVYCLYKDDIGNMWVGTYSGGVNFLPKFGAKFRTYRHSPVTNSLSNNLILSIQGDADGFIWLGTDGGGLNRFDRKTNTFSVFRHQPTNGNSPDSDYIISLVAVKKNLLALGYHRKGFDLVDTKNGVLRPYKTLKGNAAALATTSVLALATDTAATIWVGTWEHGLYGYNRLTKEIRHFLHVPNNTNTLGNNNVGSIVVDEAGNLWLGTENGLDRFTAKTNTFTHFRHDPKNNGTIRSNTVTSLLNADKEHLWVGTAGGLCLLNKKTNRIETAITEKEGLSNRVINAMLDDTKGNLWISTNKGISRYNLRSKTIRNYSLSDGIQGNEFKPGSAYRTADGTLFFGGSDGLNSFHPDSMQDNTFVPPVYITDVQIFNKSVYAGESGSPLTKPISETKEITLTHDQGVFSVEFSALNYTLPQKNQYAYKLEGFDKEWNYSGTKRSATYTNLDQGQYTFRVKASNNDGIWNDTGTTLSIVILPPYWQTWWFMLALIGIGTGSAYAFYRSRINAVKAQKWALERIVEERTERLQQEQVLNRLKSQFVSTASHEFRTPLATMQSSLDLMKMYLDAPMSTGKAGIQKHLTVIEKQIDRFIDLMDDILTIEKMSAGKMAFKPVRTDVTALCTTVIATHFDHRKDNRLVAMQVNGIPRPMHLDEKIFGQALTNLLTNAFKFSATNPALHLLFGADCLFIRVVDQGIGIPPKDVPHLFETFFRAGNASGIQGTGLGLFIIKQAIERHGGTVAVQSQENVGTTFTLTLPYEPVLSPLPD